MKKLLLPLLVFGVVLTLGCLDDFYIGNYDFSISSKKTSCDQITFDDICIDCNMLESGKTVQCNLDFEWKKKYLWEICTPESAWHAGRAPRFGQGCASRTFNTTECYLLLEGKLGEKISQC